MSTSLTVLYVKTTTSSSGARARHEYDTAATRAQYDQGTSTVRARHEHSTIMARVQHEHGMSTVRAQYEHNNTSTTQARAQHEREHITNTARARA